MATLPKLIAKLTKSTGGDISALAGCQRRKWRDAGTKPFAALNTPRKPHIPMMTTHPRRCGETQVGVGAVGSILRACRAIATRATPPNVRLIPTSSPMAQAADEFLDQHTLGTNLVSRSPRPFLRIGIGFFDGGEDQFLVWGNLSRNLFRGVRGRARGSRNSCPLVQAPPT